MKRQWSCHNKCSKKLVTLQFQHCSDLMTILKKLFPHYPLQNNVFYKKFRQVRESKKMQLHEYMGIVQKRNLKCMRAVYLKT